MRLKKIEIILILIKRFKDDDVTAWASKLSYYILLSTFPFLLFIMQLLSYTSIGTVQVLTQFKDIVPDEILSLLQIIINEIQNNKNNTVLSVSIIATIWAASKGIMAIISSLNKAYREEETRSYFFVRGMAYIYTIAFAFIIVINFALIVFGNKILSIIFSYIYLPTALEGILNLIRILFSMVLLFFFFILLYNATPNKKISFSEVVPGSIFSTIGWLSMSFIFSFYVNNLGGNFSYTYGSLAGIIIVLIWLYLCSIILIMGGELNAITSENQRK